MRSALRLRRTDERARRHLVNRIPQAGSANTAVGAGSDEADSGFSLTGPITITVFVPPSTSATAITTLPTTSTTSTSTNTPTIFPTPTPSTSSTSSDSTTTASPNGGNVQPSISVVPSQGSNDADNAPAPGVNGALNTGSNLSTGAIVGIIIAILVVLVLAALVLLRRKNLFARKKRRATWLAKGGIMGPQPIEGYDSFLPISNEKPPPAPVPAGFATPYNPTNMSYSAALPTGNSGLAPPPMSYNPQSAAPVLSPIFIQEGVSVQVGCTFIPTLPDELNIITGETLRILAEYDDGWGLCVNALDERGMVPLECLDRKGGGASPSGSVEGRDYRRASSLSGSPAHLAPNRLN